jgi:hypothetical protein
MTDSFAELAVLSELGDALHAGFRRAEAAEAGRGRRPFPRLRGRRRFIAVVAAALLIGTGALAAAGVIGDGTPLRPAPHSPHNPSEGLGVVRAGTGVMLPLLVDDPAGGPPWGARFVSTTRGLGCLQIGRVVDGRVGVLGQDGAFANDGRFHPLSINYFGSGSVVGPFPCGTLDAKGHAFAHIYMHGVAASGLVLPSSAQRGCAPNKAYHRGGITIPRCPSGDLRAITTGMAGPQAVSVTYRDRGQIKTLNTVGSQGAYLIVRRVSPSERQLGTFEPGGAGALVAINYSDGTGCRLKRFAMLNQTCPPVGRVEPPAVRRAEVAAPVSVRIGKGHFGRAVVASFVARKAVTDARAAYTWTLRLSGPQVNCRAIVSGPALRNVKVGERVEFHQPTDGCRGVFHGKVEYHYGLSEGQPLFGSGKSVLVGRFTIDAR